MDNKWHYIVGAIFIPCLIGGITLIDTHPNWAYALFAIAVVAIFWGIYPLLFKRVSVAMRQSEQHPKIVLSDDDKDKIIVLMDLVNTLDDKMGRFFNEALYQGRDRVVKYQSLLDSPDFSGLWGKYLSQRATISVVSPELEERVRLLLSLVQGCHKNTLSKQYSDQLSELSKQLDEQTMAIESLRKGIKQTIEKLIA